MHGSDPTMENRELSRELRNRKPPFPLFFVFSCPYAFLVCATRLYVAVCRLSMGVMNKDGYTGSRGQVWIAWNREVFTKLLEFQFNA